MYGCGLRSSEALKLTVADVDLKEGILVIRDSKNHNSRLVTMDTSLVQACEKYLLINHKESSDETFLFPTRIGINKPYAHSTIYWHFREALNVCGIIHSGRGNGPRLHDLRHTFSVHSLNKMVKSGMDIYTSLPILSSYLGHKSIIGTQQYLRLTIEIYPEITESMEHYCQDVFPEVTYDE